jgi:hypothetical protein
MRAMLATVPLLLAGTLFFGCVEDQSGLVEAQNKLIKSLEERVASLEARPTSSADRIAPTVGDRNLVDDEKLRSELRKMRQDMNDMIGDRLAAERSAMPRPAATESIDRPSTPTASGPVEAEVQRAMATQFAEMYAAERKAEAERERTAQRERMRSGRETMISRGLDRIAERVNLSDLDKAKVTEIALSSFDLTTAMNDRFRERQEAGEEISREDRMREAEQIRTQTEASLKVALSPEQFEAVRPIVNFGQGFARGEGMAFEFPGGEGGATRRFGGGTEGGGATTPAPRGRGGNRGGNNQGGSPAGTDG